MTGLDTTVLVRYLAQDDPAQSARATRLIEEELGPGAQGYLSLLVVVETWWVLKRLYGATPAELRRTVEDLLGARQLVVERTDLLTAAVALLAAHPRLDLADAVIAISAREAGCARTVTFDREAVRAGMRLLT